MDQTKQYSLGSLAIQVETMRNTQKLYFQLAGKARGTKNPEDRVNAKTVLDASKKLEKVVDEVVFDINFNKAKERPDIHMAAIHIHAASAKALSLYVALDEKDHFIVQEIVGLMSKGIEILCGTDLIGCDGCGTRLQGELMHEDFNDNGDNYCAGCVEAIAGDPESSGKEVVNGN